MNEYVYKENSRPEIKPFLPQQYKKVLEIGCGLGGFKETLNSDVDLWGVEPDGSAANIAVSKGYQVLVGTYDDIESELPDHYFDLIICNDVIEHMDKYDQFLIDIKRKMAPNASLVGSIPNIRNYLVLIKLILKKDWQYISDGVMDKTHLRFFTEKSLRRTFQDTGYMIEAMQGINSKLIKETGLRKVIINILINYTFGLFKDTEHLQFAFRVKPNSSSN